MKIQERKSLSRDSNFSTLLSAGASDINKYFPQLYSILLQEYERQKNVLMMVASCSLVSPAILACQGMPLVNITAEGYPGMRYHAGCIQIDKVEGLAIDMAKRAFNAKYANVQPHSASTANEIVMFSLLNANDVILGMNLSSGGHLSHGADVSYSGTFFQSVKYGLDKDYLIDFNQVESLALKHKPKMIVCGTTAYTREINFKIFREIADRVGAYLIADISHIAGLVIAGLHPSPIDFAHITTTCTHKQLCGPRGGLILSGKDFEMEIEVKGHRKQLFSHLQSAVFPFFQGAPIENIIAAKAMTLQLAMSEEYSKTMRDIIKTAQTLAKYFVGVGYNVISGGTDTHMILIDLTEKGITGQVAEKALEQCGIIVNKNSVPNSQNHKKIPTGIRIGTNSLAQRKFSQNDIIKCAKLIDLVLSNILNLKDNNVRVDSKVKHIVLESVGKLCEKNPIPNYT